MQSVKNLQPPLHACVGAVVDKIPFIFLQKYIRDATHTFIDVQCFIFSNGISRAPALIGTGLDAL